MHLGLVKLQDRDRRNADKLKKTGFLNEFKQLLGKLHRDNDGVQFSFGDVLFQGSNGRAKLKKNGEYQLTGIEEWKVIFRLKAGEIDACYPLFPKLNRPSVFSFSSSLGSKIHQSNGTQWIMERFCFVSISHEKDLVSGAASPTVSEDASTSASLDADMITAGDAVKADVDSKIDAGIKGKRYRLLARSTDLLCFFDNCRAKCEINSKMLLPLSDEVLKEASNWTLGQRFKITVAHQSTLPGLVGFMMATHVEEYLEGESVDLSESDSVNAIKLALRSVLVVYSEDEAPNTMSKQSKRVVESDLAFSNFIQMAIAESFIYNERANPRLFLESDLDPKKNRPKRQFLELDAKKTSVCTVKFVAKGSGNAENTIPTLNRFSPLSLKETAEDEPETLLTKEVVTTLKSHAEEKVEVLKEGAITHTLEVIVESKYNMFYLIKSLNAICLDNETITKVFEDNRHVYNSARAVFGAMCHFRDLMILEFIKIYAGEEIPFLFERFCFFKPDVESINVLNADDLIIVKKIIIDSIAKSPAVAILEILNMMSKKEKGLKFLYLILQGFNANQPPSLTSIQPFNPKKKDHAMSIKKKRAYFIVEEGEEVFMFCYDSSKNELVFRQELLKLLLQSIPDDIAQIINETRLYSLKQWYSDHKEFGLSSFKKGLEQSFKDANLLLDIDAHEEVNSLIVFMLHVLIYNVDGVQS